jgi:hypothetical protein
MENDKASVFLFLLFYRSHFNIAGFRKILYVEATQFLPICPLSLHTDKDAGIQETLFAIDPTGIENEI